jgi:hypothetical protein
MSFLVYFFVLLVAAGSVIFGLDWTQAPLNPPPYAKLPTQQAVAAAPAPVMPKQHTVGASAREVALKTPAAEPASSGSTAANKTGNTTDEATQAQASATDSSADQADKAGTTAAAAHCNVSACSASYRSFRASDCTYQPYEGARRLCTRTSAKVAAASHPHSVRHADARGEARITDRRDYPDRGWGFGFFGGDAYSDR